MKGSCLCNSVQYVVTRLATAIVHCSCKTCRKAHSAAFNTGAGVMAEDFSWTRGQSELTAYESSPGKKRYFCKKCGSQILAIKEGSPHYVLRVATLDEDPESLPQYRIWKSQEVSWLNYENSIPAYEEWKPESI
ncbi:MAG: GFA family protein [SAR324 cluster bacterium]|nr:GFA family protein [SAR324 cluster bacterium]